MEHHKTQKKMLQAIAIRIRDGFIRTSTSSWFQQQPPMLPPLAFAFANNHAPHFMMDVENEEEFEEEIESSSILMMAVPKRRVSHRRKRIKFAQKHLKPVQSFTTCPNCKEVHPQYYQLCPFCQPFNNFIKTKDAPVREYDRVTRIVENKILAKLEEEQKVKEAAKAQPPPITNNNRPTDKT